MRLWQRSSTKLEAEKLPQYSGESAAAIIRPFLPCRDFWTRVLLGALLGPLWEGVPGAENTGWRRKRRFVEWQISRSSWIVDETHEKDTVVWEIQERSQELDQESLQTKGKWESTNKGRTAGLAQGGWAPASFQDSKESWKGAKAPNWLADKAQASLQWCTEQYSDHGPREETCWR